MSVFKSIKGTFQAGLKSITSRDTSKDEKVKYVRSPVNIDAGADLLNKYQNIWKELHENAEICARSAEDADAQITQLYVNYDRQEEVMNGLHKSVAELPVILTQLQELTDVLASLDEEYDKAEVALVHLENLCEEQELARAKVVDAQKLSAYRERRHDELEKIKVQLAKDHARKIQGHEKQRQTKLKERQEVFEEKFKDDLEYYKSHGRLDRQSTSSTESAKKAEQLEDINWDMGDTGLDEFLGTDQYAEHNDDLDLDDAFDDIESIESQSEEEEEPEERVDVTLMSNSDLTISDSTENDKSENSHGNSDIKDTNKESESNVERDSNREQKEETQNDDGTAEQNENTS